jgi:hypothetical protein
MAMRWAGVMQVGRLVLRQILLGLLLAWTAAVPVVWVVRDGLGPDSVETGWVEGAFKFLTLWGVPALVLAVPLLVLAVVDRRRAGNTRGRQAPSF